MVFTILNFEFRISNFRVPSRGFLGQLRLHNFEFRISNFEFQIFNLNRVVKGNFGCPSAWSFLNFEFRILNFEMEKECFFFIRENPRNLKLTFLPCEESAGSVDVLASRGT